MSEKPIRPWMQKVAATIVKNVVQYWIDYKRTNCAEDVAQEIANACPVYDDKPEALFKVHQKVWVETISGMRHAARVRRKIFNANMNVWTYQVTAYTKAHQTFLKGTYYENRIKPRR